VKEPWLARCLNEECRREIEPALDSIKNAGTGACRHCGGYGIKSDDEALLYLMTHADYNAAKIGIAKVGSKRIAHHEGVGWSLASTTTLRGREARFIEDAVLACWKALNLPYGVPPTHMPYAGYTETVSLALRSLDAIREDIARAIARAERQ
jgi:hypothetical protein